MSFYNLSFIKNSIDEGYRPEVTWVFEISWSFLTRVWVGAWEQLIKNFTFGG